MLPLQWTSPDDQLRNPLKETKINKSYNKYIIYADIQWINLQYLGELNDITQSKLYLTFNELKFGFFHSGFSAFSTTFGRKNISITC